MTTNNSSTNEKVGSADVAVPAAAKIRTAEDLDLSSIKSPGDDMPAENNEVFFDTTESPSKETTESEPPADSPRSTILDKEEAEPKEVPSASNPTEDDEKSLTKTEEAETTVPVAEDEPMTNTEVQQDSAESSPGKMPEDEENADAMAGAALVTVTISPENEAVADSPKTDLIPVLSFEECSLSEKAMRLGLDITKDEYEDDASAEKRLERIIDEYKKHLDSQVGEKVLNEVLKTSPCDVPDDSGVGSYLNIRQAVHERRLHILVLSFRTTFHKAWHCTCEEVCSGDRFYCLEQSALYRKDHNGEKPGPPSAQICYSCYDSLMIRGGDPPQLELSQKETTHTGFASLSTGVLTGAKGCDSCFCDLVNKSEVSTEAGSCTSDEKAKSLKMGRLDDPFAAREGKTLSWSDVSLTLNATGKKEEKKILNNVWGEVPCRETTAIIGASGAGKTSLLNILAGRVRTNDKVTVEADVRLNNFGVDPTDIKVRKSIAYVAQEESIMVTATPREAIYFSAKLRLPVSTTEEELQSLTTRMLSELGLVDCADTMVGGALIKGVSGGEKKRAAIGVELVVKPNLLFLDEPTSGLDSFSAVQLCQVLKKVANAGATVLFTIHQPSSALFASFDRLILLNKGRVMYQGPVDEVSTYFSLRGYPSPPNYNPADWIMSIAQSVPIPDLDEANFFPKDDREAGVAIVAIVAKDTIGVAIVTPGLGTEIKMLMRREILNLKRDKVAVMARILFTLFLSILIGVIFLDVASSDYSENANINSAFGALIMVLLMSMFGSAQPELLAFPEQRPVFLREYSTNHYSVTAYFMARLTMEVWVTALQNLLLAVICYFLIGFKSNFLIFYATTYTLAMASTALGVLLGSAVENPKLGQEFLPVLFVPQMLFAGFFVAPDLIPVWLRWARYICTMTWALRILLVEEFDRDCGSVRGDKNCMDLLESVDADPDETWWNWIVLVALFVVFRLGALFILKKKANKFY